MAAQAPSDGGVGAQAPAAAAASGAEEVGNFCVDVARAVRDYCDDGIDEFERCLHAAGGRLDEGTRTCLDQLVDWLHRDLTSKMDASMTLFMELCQANTVHAQQHHLPALPSNVALGDGAPAAAPPVATQQGVAVDAPEAPQEAPDATQRRGQGRAEVEGALASLRGELTQLDAECRALAQQMQGLDAEIQQSGAHLGALQAVVGTLSAAGVERGGGEAAAGAERGGEAVRGDLRAIGAARQRLQPLVQRAWELAEEHATLAKLSGVGPLQPSVTGRVVLGSTDNIMLPFP